MEVFSTIGIATAFSPAHAHPPAPPFNGIVPELLLTLSDTPVELSNLISQLPEVFQVSKPKRLFLAHFLLPTEQGTELLVLLFELHVLYPQTFHPLLLCCQLLSQHC